MLIPWSSVDAFGCDKDITILRRVSMGKVKSSDKLLSRTGIRTTACEAPGAAEMVVN